MAGAAAEIPATGGLLFSDAASGTSGFEHPVKMSIPKPAPKSKYGKPRFILVDPFVSASVLLCHVPVKYNRMMRKRAKRAEWTNHP